MARLNKAQKLEQSKKEFDILVKEVILLRDEMNTAKKRESVLMDQIKEMFHSDSSLLVSENEMVGLATKVLRTVADMTPYDPAKVEKVLPSAVQTVKVVDQKMVKASVKAGLITEEMDEKLKLADKTTRESFKAYEVKPTLTVVK